jgi:ribosomal protein S11
MIVKLYVTVEDTGLGEDEVCQQLQTKLFEIDEVTDVAANPEDDALLGG